MMDCTDRHYRFFMRGLTRCTMLYTEMVTANAIIHGDRGRLLAFNCDEHPISLQLGGSDPEALALAAKIGEDYGYDEININVGCPSDRVQKGRFGACLMKEASLVAECVQAMQHAVSVPVTVKTRLGVDELDSYAFARQFIQTVTDVGCTHFVMHARKAWLKGLSPKENRDVPPLQYERVYQLKRDFPDLHIGINGGIKTLASAHEHLRHVDEVMIGREAYSNPGIFAAVDVEFYHQYKVASAVEAVMRYLPYLSEQMTNGIRMRTLIRPLIGLFQGLPGARAWRRYLSVHGGDERRGPAVVETALKEISQVNC